LSFQISKCLACATTPQIFSAKHETVEHVILTKNGYGDMVVVSYEEYQRIQHVLSVMAQLREAEWESRSTNSRFMHGEVMDSLRERVRGIFER